MEEEKSVVISPENSSDDAIKGDEQPTGRSDSKAGHVDQLEAESAELDQDLELAQQEADLGSKEVASKLFAELGAKYWSRYHLLRSKYDLDRAIKYSELALDLTPPDEGARESRLDNLRLALFERFELGDEENDLHRAIELCQEQAHLEIYDRQDGRSIVLRDLALWLFTRQSLTEQNPDLGESIKLTEQALNLVASRASETGLSCLSQLESFFDDSYRVSNSRADLDRAIELAQEAAALSGGSEDETMYLHTYSMWLLRRYELTSSRPDLDLAIELNYKSLGLATDDWDRAHYLHSTAKLLAARSSCTGQHADLDRGIELATEALALVPQGSRDQRIAFNVLSLLILDRYDMTPVRADLDRALELARQASNGPMDDALERSVVLNNYAMCLAKRHGLDGEKCDLDHAIKLAEEALALSEEDGSVVNQSGNLSNLAGYYETRYRATSTPRDLDHAIELAQQAIGLSQRGSTTRPLFAMNLGMYLSSRYELIGSKADLDLSIDLMVSAINETPQGSKDSLIGKTNLGGVLVDRYLLTKDQNDLDEAIRLSREALATSLPGSEARSFGLNNLGKHLGTRYRARRAPTDLDDAIKATEEALRDLTARDAELRPVISSNLGFHLGARFKLKGDKADLDRAIQLTQQAIQLIPDGSEHSFAIRNNLADHFYTKFKLTGAQGSLDQAIECFQISSEASAAAPADRLLATMGLFGLHAGAGDWTSARSVGLEAIKFLPRFTPRFLSAPDKYQLLSKINGLASATAAVCLELGNVLEAIQCLEQGRNVLGGETFDIRSGLPRLELRYPDIAKRFIEVLGRLNAPIEKNAFDGKGYSFSNAKERETANGAYDEIVKEVRTLPSFEDFLQPPSRSIIQKAALKGPVIYVNVHTFRCDAVIIRPDSIDSVPLPRLSHKDITSRQESLDKSSQHSQGVLEWLWDTIALPVLEKLELKDSTSDELPRLWWIPTGPLSQFPLHAAGYHRSAEPRTVLDVAMSSFSSSLRALQQSRSAAEISKSIRVALVAMEETPGMGTLSFASVEAETIKTACENYKHELQEPQPLKDSVLAALQSCDVFHFAGHGETGVSDPLQSKLLLKDWQSDPLTVTQLLEAKAAENLPLLAYLSACGTGQIRDQWALDESIHLISSFQLAGFRHVIGTLWQVDDEVCKDVARCVYQEIMKENLTDDSVCRGLHKALKQLRDEWRLSTEDFTARSLRDFGPSSTGQSAALAWVPYVHFGA
jgi:hypothetical protein